MNNFKERAREIITTGVVTVGTTSLLAVQAFASETGVTAGMGTALDAVKTDALAVLGVVAPIGLSISGAFIVWRLGMKFFKSLAQ